MALMAPCEAAVKRSHIEVQPNPGEAPIAAGPENGDSITPREGAARYLRLPNTLGAACEGGSCRLHW